jgi:hypothetical protein
MHDAGGAVIGVLCTVEDVTTQIADQQILKRREQALATLAEIQRQLLAWQWDWQEPAITQVFAALGEISGASRVYYYELQGGHHEPLSLCQRVEWAAQGIASTLDDPRFQIMPLDPLFTDWHDQLSRQRVINLVEADFSDLQRQVLARSPSSVKSLCCCP